MARFPVTTRQTIPAIKVKQWLANWDEVTYDSAAQQRKPDDHFFVFSISAKRLKALSGIYRRTIQGDGERTGIQRRHDPDRSSEIARFVLNGYPWSELPQRMRESDQYLDLRKPGWLPTAIVVNIIKPEDRRRGLKVDQADLVSVDLGDPDRPEIVLPTRLDKSNWRSSELPPLEVIDGQHRLWAFADDDVSPDFEVPVVAFYGLDVSWQAYLFWTINIKPKRINSSLAFDLYPLLRNQDWLNRFEGPHVYRESRAQELVEMLWSIPKSPWHQRINMLGDRGGPAVTQAAWIHSLVASYIKPYEGRGIRIGGLFGSPVGTDETVLPWGRVQQAAFLIMVWEAVLRAINSSTNSWALDLRRYSRKSSGVDDPAFSGQYSLLNTDQGVRGVLYVTNDIVYLRSEALELDKWFPERKGQGDTELDIETALTSLRRHPVFRDVQQIANRLADFDWRSSATPELSDQVRSAKLGFRGSSGYREIRRLLLKEIAKDTGPIGSACQSIGDALGMSI